MKKNDIIEKIFTLSIYEYLDILKNNFNGSSSNNIKNGSKVLLFYSDKFSILKLTLIDNILASNDYIIKNNKKYYITNIYDTDIYIEPNLKYNIIKLKNKLIVVNIDYNAIEIYNINGNKIKYSNINYLNIISDISDYLNGKYEYNIDNITIKLNSLFIPFLNMVLINNKIIEFTYSNNVIYDLTNKTYYNLTEKINKIEIFDNYIKYNSIDNLFELYLYL